MGLAIGTPGSAVDVSEDGFEVTWTGSVSKAMTRAASSRIELASILAMFDQVTTWTHFTGDKYSRPGVSVTLSAVFGRRRDAQ